MAIDFACGCGKWLQVDEQYGGKQAKCPSCGRLVTVPLAPAALAAASPGPPPVPSHYPGQRHTSYAEAERFRKVSTTALWTGILGCVAPILGFLISMMAAASAHRYRGPSPELGILVLLLFVAGAGMSITGIITGAMGMKQDNTRYKGQAIAGLVTGIVGTCIAGCILVCVLAAVSSIARYGRW
ncbi:MAG: hypothetical protein FJ291_11480 [Planctomycetes bacterium]|nr:hypothetical protein [Planctomycetota bacterium]